MEYEKLGRKNRERYLDKVILEKRGFLRHGLLGQGSFSDVYCVEDLADNRLYVCKISWRARMLETEARVMEGLRHPLFPEYGAFWVEGGLGILLREYVPGRSLEEMLGRRRFSARQTIRVGQMLAEGLRYVHELPEPLLFRDIKPANIVIRQDGKVALIDLGCVCEMGKKVGSRAGSPGFAAPEQLRGDGILTAVCDVYGLGQTLKTMLGTGRHEVSRSGGLERSVFGGLGRIGKPVCHGFGGPGRSVAWFGNGKKRRQKKLEKKLWRVLEACTKEETACRIPDMESVIQALERLEASFAQNI